jgi:methionine-rich copper-binding protein CopC
VLRVAVVTVLIAVTLVTVTVAAAPAHSILLDSTPMAGASFRLPGRVTLRFNNRIEKPLSQLKLIGPGGAVFWLSIDPVGDADRLTALAPGMAAGAYTLEWQVLSTDGHVVSGRFSFTVVP